MPWITTKTGKRINTDWFTDEDKKQLQIKRNEEQAKALNKPVDVKLSKEKELITDSDLPPAVRMSNLLAKKGISQEWEIADYLRNLSPTRKSRLAGQMGIGGRGEEKIKAMAHAIYLAGKNDNTPAQKPMPVEPPKKETPQTKKIDFNYPQYENVLGKKKDVDPLVQLTECNAGTYINPNWKDYRTLTPAEQKQNKLYHTNCALCTTAIVLQSHGYDVEAMPRDKKWRGCETIFDYDYDNPDNFLIGSARNGWDNFSITKRCISKAQQNDKEYQRMPIGARQASNAIVEKMKKWGSGAIAELSVDWKGAGAHSVSVINQGGTIFIFDGQVNRLIIGSTGIEAYLKRTIASHTQLVRMDNVPLKDSPGIAAELSQMVRPRRNSSVGQQISQGLEAAGIDWNKF